MDALNEALNRLHLYDIDLLLHHALKSLIATGRATFDDRLLLVEIDAELDMMGGIVELEPVVSVPRTRVA